MMMCPDADAHLELDMKRSIMARAFPGLPLLLGGTGIMAGAVLPWMTLLAGLHPLRGIIGLNGKLLFGVGAICFLAGVTLIARPMKTHLLPASFGFAGAAVTVMTAWLIGGMQAMQADLGRNPMTLAQPGPGLLVAAAGGVIVSLMLLVPAAETRS